jgi:hypothetical protein
MGFKVRDIGKEKCEVLFQDEPAFICALPIAPAVREPELDIGSWLVVTFPPWSCNARPLVTVAINAVKRLKGTFRLGVRPYWKFEEINTWWPQDQSRPEPPRVCEEYTETWSARWYYLSVDRSAETLWLVLRDGNPVYQAAGARTETELVELLQGFLSS